MKQLEALLEGAAVGVSIGQVFSCMGIAEEEISAYQRRHRSRAQKANRAFRWLLPSDLLRGKSEKVYRAHVRELIDRVARGQNPIPLTKAEVLSLLSAQSLIAPLAAQYSACMGKLFRDLGLGDVEATPEPWKGASEELLDELRRKHSKDPSYNPRLSVDS